MRCSVGWPRFIQTMSSFLVCFLIGSVFSGVKCKMIEASADISGPATLPCKVSNQGLNNSVQWYKKPNTLLSIGKYFYNTRMSISQESEEEWNIHIRRVHVDDAGQYTCKVGEKVMAKVSLVVKSPPVIHETHTMTFEEGDTGILWCNVTGFPTPSVRWYWKSPHKIEEEIRFSKLPCLRMESKYNSDIDDFQTLQKVKRMYSIVTDSIKSARSDIALSNTKELRTALSKDSGAEGARLVLHNITRYYDNIYICKASNSVAANRREIRVHVKFGPEVGVFQETITATVGQKVKLHCAVEAFPMEGELEWVFENGQEICAGEKYDIIPDRELVKDFNTQFLSMVIKEGYLGVGDYGKYVCRTKNFASGYNEKTVVIQKPIEDQDNVENITDINF